MSPINREQLFRQLETLGIETRTVDHEAVFTVAQSGSIDEKIPGGHTKNLFLKDAKGKLFLVVALSSTKVDLKALSNTIGSARLSFGKAELLDEVLGVAPGSVTPLSLVNDADNRVTVIIDAELMKFDMITCHPLENTATTSIARDDLMRFIRISGHEPKVAALTADESSKDVR